MHRELGVRTMALLQERRDEAIQARFEEGHRAYVATVDGTPAAWGWVATRTATIGEPKVGFAIPGEVRYLWNFVTLRPFRGRGIYPRLLEAIVEAEAAEAEQFWIASAPENHASGSGIEKAGFSLVADLSFDVHGRAVVRDIRSGGGRSASRLLGLPDTKAKITQCWRCARESSHIASSCSSGSCSCDYQRPESACTEEVIP